MENTAKSVRNALSLTTSVFQSPAPQQYTDTLRQTLTLCARAGFDGVDFNFSQAAKLEHPLAEAGWEAWVDAIGQHLADSGLRLVQAHSLVFRSIVSTDMSLPDRPFFEERIRRTIQAAGRLKTPCLVFHPTDFALDASYDAQKNRDFNLRYWPPFIELALRENLLVAFENLYPSGYKPHRYCSDYQELIDLVDRFHDPRVGICWDTGHAQCARQNQKKALLAIGDRLMATHIHDNGGRVRDDEHLLPYQGSNDWESILSALAAIRYEGPLSLEIRNVSGNLPEELKFPHLQYAHQVGRYMVQRIAQERVAD